MEMYMHIPYISNNEYREYRVRFASKRTVIQ